MQRGRGLREREIEKIQYQFFEINSSRNQESNEFQEYVTLPDCDDDDDDRHK